MVKSYSFSPHWAMITTMFQEKSNRYHIAQPIIRRFFSQNLCHFVHFRAVSLIHSALQWNAATLRKVLAPFSFSHVIDSCSLFISFISFLFFPLSFLIFLNTRACWISNDYNQLGATRLVGYHSLVIIRYPARPRRIIVNYFIYTC